MIRIAIVGTGISALAAAHSLKPHADVTLFDKSRRVGGRLATRNLGPHQFDHGANFFNVKTATFKDWIQPMVDKGILQCWRGVFAEFDGNKMISKRIWNDDPPHYVGVPDMNAMPTYLAKDLDIHRQTKITKIERADKWSLTDDQGNSFDGFDWVIITAPAAQTQALMPICFYHMNAIENVKMMACFTLMLGFEEPLPLPFTASVVKNADVSWIAVNDTKPGRNSAFSLIANASNRWSDAHLDDDHDTIIDHITHVTSHIINMDLPKPSHTHLHRWKYANALKQKPPLHLVDTTNQLAACGDWCTQGRVESAGLSGLQTADSILKIITKDSACSNTSPYSVPKGRLEARS